MPVFIYKCKKCGKQFEVLVGMTEKKDTLKCPSCGSEKVEKALSTFQVKGGLPDTTPSCPTGTCPTCI